MATTVRSPGEEPPAPDAHGRPGHARGAGLPELIPLVQLGQGHVVNVEFEDDVEDLVVEAAVGEHAGPEVVPDRVVGVDRAWPVVDVEPDLARSRVDPGDQLTEQRYFFGNIGSMRSQGSSQASISFNGAGLGGEEIVLE